MAEEVKKRASEAQEKRHGRRYKGTGQPWERQFNESLSAFTAYELFQNQGSKRTLTKVVEILGCNRTNVTRWKSRWAWNERALAWDNEQARVRRAAFLGEIEEMGRRQARNAQDISDALMVPVMAFLDNRDLNPDILRGMKSDELFALVARAAKEWPGIMKAERLARGETTEIIDHGGQVGINHGLQSEFEEKLKDDPESRELLKQLYRRARKLPAGGAVEGPGED